MEFHIRLRHKPTPRPVSCVGLPSEASQASPPIRAVEPALSERLIRGLRRSPWTKSGSVAPRAKESRVVGFSW
jgi:hypothetical protein